ncbi:CBS domain-containing protein [Tessaracoccus sp. Y36]|uniref:CBS domain-containing protein n=1 Tax=Tessaracoccus sp. MC1756 TaxID=2760311 RepID=UPI001601DB1D|nr:CBS domain-containing protein [Tessaracoccus sp. MC1756]MBB1509801.1 CBS domain-containing protein [Tessaracoccus sp. MC1756]
MTTARELMTSPAQCLAPDDTLVDAAKQLAQHDVGSMPVLENGRLVGVLTDRDIVVNGIAKGVDPASCSVRDVATRDVVCVDVDDDASVVAKVLADNQIRRVPVLDGDEVVGIVAQADVAVQMDVSTVGETVGAISEE